MNSPLPQPVGKPPSVVTLIVRFLYASLAIGVASYFWGWFTFKDFDLSGVFFINFFINLLWWNFFLWLTFKIAEGANPARIIFVVSFLLHIVSFIHSSLDLISLSIIWGLLNLACFGLQAAACIMLFSPGARFWFHPEAGDGNQGPGGG